MHRIYEWFRWHRFAVDLIGAALLWIVLALTTSPQWFPEFVVATLLIAPLAWRRTRPVVAGSAVAIVALVQWAFAVRPMPADIAVILVVYSLSAYGPRWASLGGFALALALAIMLETRYFGNDLSSRAESWSLAGLSDILFPVLLIWFAVALAWTLGYLTRGRRLREQALEDRARRLEVEQQQERALAASDERAHIAREMHDMSPIRSP